MDWIIYIHYKQIFQIVIEFAFELKGAFRSSTQNFDKKRMASLTQCRMTSSSRTLHRTNYGRFLSRKLYMWNKITVRAETEKQVYLTYIIITTSRNF